MADAVPASGSVERSCITVVRRREFCKEVKWLFEAVFFRHPFADRRQMCHGVVACGAKEYRQVCTRGRLLLNER